jgi:NitT/TauT family transport system ATP-binding protein
MAAIDVRQASKTFSEAGNSTQAFVDVSLAITTGEIVAVVGPSGCGKTTLLRCIAGLDFATSGTVLVAGKPSASVSRSSIVALSAQTPTLLPWRTIFDNVALPQEIANNQSGLTPDEALRRVGLEGFGPRYPHELSGGMRQRAVLARAMIWAPDVLLLDEPFSALDDHSRAAMNCELRSLRDNRGTTVLLVTHSLVEAVFCSERVVVLSPRPGRVERIVDINLPHERSLDNRRLPSFDQALGAVREAIL